MASESVAKTYYKELKKVARQSYVPAKHLEAINTGLQEFIEQNPDCTYDDILAEFGTPQDVLDEILGDVSCIDIISKEKKKRKLMFIFIPIGALLIAGAIFGATMWVKLNDASAVYIEMNHSTETTSETN